MHKKLVSPDWLKENIDENRFEQEGRLRRSIFRNGQWRDILIYGLLRQEASNIKR